MHQRHRGCWKSRGGEREPVLIGEVGVGREPILHVFLDEAEGIADALIVKELVAVVHMRRRVIDDVLPPARKQCLNVAGRGNIFGGQVVDTRQVDGRQYVLKRALAGPRAGGRLGPPTLLLRRMVAVALLTALAAAALDMVALVR